MICKMSPKVYAGAHLMNIYNFVYLTGNDEGTIFPGQVQPEKICYRMHVFDNLRQKKENQTRHQ